MALLVLRIATRNGPDSNRSTKSSQDEWNDKPLYRTSVPTKSVENIDSQTSLQNESKLAKKGKDAPDDNTKADLPQHKIDTKMAKNRNDARAVVTPQARFTAKETQKKNIFDRNNVMSRRTTPIAPKKSTAISRISTEMPKRKIKNNEELCCKTLNLTSTGETLNLYSFVLGVYHLTEDDRTVYKKEGQNRFISRPPGLTRKGVNTFSWGLNSNPDGKWGWIKAFGDGKCPHLIGHWKAYDRKKKTWVADEALTFQCI